MPKPALLWGRDLLGLFMSVKVGEHNRSPRDHLDKIARQRSFEREVGTFVKTEVEERIYRDKLAELDATEKAIYDAVRGAIRERLSMGSFHAFGRTSPYTDVDLVPRQHWHFLEIDFERSSAEGGGLAYHGLMFVDEKRVEELRNSLPERLLRKLGLIAEPPPTPVAPQPEPAPTTHPYRTGVAGRPTTGHLVLAKFRERADAGLAELSIAAEAQALKTWLDSEHPDAPNTTEKTIKNKIRDEHRAYRLRAQNPAKTSPE